MARGPAPTGVIALVDGSLPLSLIRMGEHKVIPDKLRKSRMCQGLFLPNFGAILDLSGGSAHLAFTIVAPVAPQTDLYRLLASQLAYQQPLNCSKTGPKLALTTLEIP